MVVTSTGSRSLVLLCERQLSAKRFTLGPVLLDRSLISLRSKFCAGLFMRTAECESAGKATLLECFNEEV